MIKTLEEKLEETRKMNAFFERNFNILQEDNKAYLQENSILKGKLFKMQEKLVKKSLLIKNSRENETILRETHILKLKEKDEQIEKLMKIMSVLPEVHLEKIEERSKIPRSFHNIDKTFDKEKNILKAMYNNLENTQKNEKTAQKSIRNNSLRQKKLSWYFS